MAMLIAMPLLAASACMQKSWERDPKIEAARRACMEFPEFERYACIEDHAVRAVEPDICRLTGKWIDDMCLQSVYEAADDPAICGRLYLKGVRPTCRRYYQRPPVDFVTDTVFKVSGERGRPVIEYQVAITHWGNRPVEELEACLVFPGAAGLPGQVELEETRTAPADVVEPNFGLIYEGKIAWGTDHSKDKVSAILDGARIRLAWTFDGERREKVFPANTDEGPDVFPTGEG